MTAPDQNPALALDRVAVVAEALYRAEHPRGEWSAGRARIIWFHRAGIALAADPERALLLDSLNQAEARVPEGWVLVPREPTEAMSLLGLQELPWGPSSPDHANRCWRAMIDAAPTAMTGSAPDAARQGEG